MSREVEEVEEEMEEVVEEVESACKRGVQTWGEWATLNGRARLGEGGGRGLALWAEVHCGWQGHARCTPQERERG